MSAATACSSGRCSGATARWTSALPASVPASRDTLGTRLLALVLLMACAVGVAWLVGLGAA